MPRHSTAPLCATSRATWRSSPTRHRTRRCPTSLNNLDYSGLSLNPLRSRATRCGAARGLKFTAEFFHRGFLYKDRVDIFEVADGRRDADPLQPRPVHLRQGAAADRRPWLRRLPPALPAQPPRLLRRSLRLPRRQLFPRGGEGPGLRAVGARPGDQDRRSRRRGIPAVPHVLAGAAGEGQRHDRGARAARQPERRRPRSASPSGPADRPCSTPRWRCIRAPTSPRPASRR